MGRSDATTSPENEPSSGFNILRSCSACCAAGKQAIPYVGTIAKARASLPDRVRAAKSHRRSTTELCVDVMKEGLPPLLSLRAL